MREVATKGWTEPAKSSAVRTATTPGAARAAAASIARMRACGWSLRRKATCSARITCRSSVKAPLPVSRRGSSVRLMRAPTSFGRAWTSGTSFISVGAFAQARPLRLVMAANDGGAARFDAPDLGQRLGQYVRVPGVARNDAGIEGRSYADRIGGQEERAGFFQRNQRGGGARRMTGQGDEHDAPIGEQIAFAVDGFGRCRALPFCGEVSGRHGIRGAGGLELFRVHDDRSALEEGVAAAMVEMQVRAQHHIDVVALQADAAQ